MFLFLNDGISVLTFKISCRYLFSISGLCSYNAQGIKETLPDYNITIRQNIAYPAKTILTPDVIDGYMSLLKQTCRSKCSHVFWILPNLSYTFGCERRHKHLLKTVQIKIRLHRTCSLILIYTMLRR